MTPRKIHVLQILAKMAELAVKFFTEPTDVFVLMVLQAPIARKNVNVSYSTILSHS